MLVHTFESRDASCRSSEGGPRKAVQSIDGYRRLGAKEPPNKRSRESRPESFAPERAAFRLHRNPTTPGGVAGLHTTYVVKGAAPLGCAWARRTARHVRALGKRVSGGFGRCHWVSAKRRPQQGTFPSWNLGAVWGFLFFRTSAYSPLLRAPGSGLPRNEARPMLRGIYFGGSRLQPSPPLQGVN